MISYFKAIRSGTARSKHGAEKDRGHIVHLVTENGYPSWETAICGIDPKGNGWFYPGEQVEVTCTKCLNHFQKKCHHDWKFNDAYGDDQCTKCKKWMNIY